MIAPTRDDIGRAVIYTPVHGAQEHGVITSFNESVVFVRYATQNPSANGQATNREDLEYASEGERAALG